MPQVDLILKAVDNASAVIRGIDNKLQGLNKNLTASVGKASISGLAIGTGFAAATAAINAATAAATAFGRALSNSAQIQSGTVLITGQVAELLNQTYQETEVLVNRLNESIIKQTASLPGLTQNYTELGRQIIDSVIPAATRLDGSLDNEKLIQYTTELSRAYGLLGATTPGLTSDAAVSTLTKALEGSTSLAQLRRLDLFQKNPILFNYLKDELARRGVEELKDLDVAARVEVLRTIGNKILTDETVARLSNTLQGRLENFITQLFDPQAGIFGLNRVLNSRANKTVIDAVNNFAGQFFDVVKVLGEILGITGLTDTSILETLYDFFNWLAFKTQEFESFLRNNQDVIANRIQFIVDFFTGNSDDSFSGFMYKLGLLIGELMNLSIDEVSGQSVTRFMYELNKGLLFFVGGLAQSFVAGAVESIPQLAAEMVEEFISIIKEIIPKIVESFKQGFADPSKFLPLQPIENLEETPAGDTAKGIFDSLGQLTKSIDFSKFLPLPVVDNKALGNIPLANAISAESRAKPGTNPVIANDSEYIFTPSQMKKLVTNLKGNVTNNVYVSGVLDESIVSQIVNALDSKFNSYNSGFLS